MDYRRTMDYAPCFGLVLTIVLICDFNTILAAYHCPAVPIQLPKIKNYIVPVFNITQSATVWLELESEYNVDITWSKAIRTQAKAPGYYAETFKVPIRSSPAHRITSSRQGNVHKGVLEVLQVDEADLLPGRFQVEITVRHPCNKLKMYLDTNKEDVQLRNVADVIVLETLPHDSVKIGFGEDVDLNLTVSYSVGEGGRVRHNPLSISKWKQYISRTGIRMSLFIFDDWNDPRQNRSGNFFTTRSDETLSPTKFRAQSSMSLKPFLQRDQGLFQTHFTYSVGNSVLVGVYVSTELRYSDSLAASLKVKTCSGTAHNELVQGILQLPVEAGVENCLQCFAHGNPLPEVYLASLDPDISSNIHFLAKIRDEDWGHLIKMRAYSLAPSAANHEQHYVCSAGSAYHVSSEVVKVVTYTKVVMVAPISDHSLNLQSLAGSPFNFTCKATGVPTPAVTFYRSPKNSALLGDVTPESLGWRPVTSDQNDAVVVENYDAATTQTVATMTLRNIDAHNDYHCVARNQFSYKVRTVMLDDFV